MTAARLAFPMKDKPAQGPRGLDKDAMSQEDLVTVGLETVNVGTAGSLAVADGAALTLTPLLHSSTEATLGDSARMRLTAAAVRRGFRPTSTSRQSGSAPATCRASWLAHSSPMPSEPPVMT